MHAAWHFWYAVVFGGESGLRKVGLGGTHPLTQRYMLSKSVSKKELKMILNHVSVGVSNVAV
ncbi:DUF3265 domain-containing protein [Vibrio vulnificus]|nr:DUF3265 domain-containing protein [Vibrio vulnificus]